MITVSVSVNGLSERRYKTWKPPNGMTARDEKKEVERQADQFESKLKSGYDVDPTITFSEYSLLWQERYAEKQHRKTTRSNDRERLERFDKFLGNVKMINLKPGHIREALDNIEKEGKQQNRKYVFRTDIETILKERKVKKQDFVKEINVAYSTFGKVLRGESVSINTINLIVNHLGLGEADYEMVSGGGDYSKKTMLNYYRLLSKMLGDAVWWKILIENPCQTVARPKPRKKKVNFLDDEQTLEFVSALLSAEEPFRTAILFILDTGCRRGESLGLQWSDINLRKKTVEFNKALLYTPEDGLFVDETKTEESDRIISISDTVVKALKEYKEWQDWQCELAGDKWVDSDSVFTDKVGRNIRPDSLTCWIRKFIDEKGLPKVTLKGLRHTSATLLIMGGLNIRSLADRLGHAKPSTSMDIYSHAIKSMDVAAANILDSIISAGISAAAGGKNSAVSGYRVHNLSGSFRRPVRLKRYG